MIVVLPPASDYLLYYISTIRKLAFSADTGIATACPRLCDDASRVCQGAGQPLVVSPDPCKVASACTQSTSTPFSLIII